jgi:hypothetical protein
LEDRALTVAPVHSPERASALPRAGAATRAYLFDNVRADP